MNIYDFSVKNRDGKDVPLSTFKGKVIIIGTPEEIRKKTKTTNLRDSFFALIGGEENE